MIRVGTEKEPAGRELTYRLLIKQLPESGGEEGGPTIRVRL